MDAGLSDSQKISCGSHSTSATDMAESASPPAREGSARAAATDAAPVKSRKSLEGESVATDTSEAIKRRKSIDKSESERAIGGTTASPLISSPSPPTGGSSIGDELAMEMGTFAAVKLYSANVFRDAKCTRLIFSFLPLSQVITMSRVSKQMLTMTKKYYQTCAVLDLSEFYGVIGSTEFDGKMFYGKFLRLFECVQRLSLRYCTHLKATHLDRILEGLTPLPDSSASDVEDLDESESAGGKVICVNPRMTSMNLYFCSRLASQSMFRLSRRCPNLRNLNIGRCHALSAKNSINSFKALINLPLERLTISLDPSIGQDEAEDLLSLLIHEDNFKKLTKLDLSHGCEVLCNVDLSDLKDKGIAVVPPSMYRAKKTMAADSDSAGASSTG